MTFISPLHVVKPKKKPSRYFMEQWLQTQSSPDSSPQSSDSVRQVVVGMRRVVYANPKMCRPSPQVQPNLTRRLLQMLGWRLGCGNFVACVIIYFLSLTCLPAYHIYPLLFALGSFSPQLFCQENLCFWIREMFWQQESCAISPLPYRLQWVLAVLQRVWTCVHVEMHTS